MRVVIDFCDYKPWSGAVDTYERIEREGKLDALEAILDEVFEDATCSDTELNDLLWFESDEVFHWLGMKTDDDIADEEYKRKEILEKLDALRVAKNDDICDLVQEIGDMVEIDGCANCPFADAEDCNNCDLVNYQQEIEEYCQLILGEMEDMYDE